MIDEKKVGLMTKISIYEKKEENRNLVVSKYYKTDYVRYNVLKQLVASTVLYWGVVALYIFMKFEDMLVKINKIDYFSVMYRLLGGYVVFCFIYFLFSYMVYSYRYSHAKKGLTKYNGYLRKLIDLEDDGSTKGKVITNDELDELFAGEEEKSILKKFKSKDAVDDISSAGDNQSEQSVFNISKSNARGNVNKMDMFNQRMKESEEEKKQQIIANANRLREREKLEEEKKLKREASIEAERKRIRERRMQLEREQMEKLRLEREQRMAQKREDYTYQENQTKIDDMNDIERGEK